MYVIKQIPHPAVVAYMSKLVVDPCDWLTEENPNLSAEFYILEDGEALDEALSKVLTFEDRVDAYFFISALTFMGYGTCNLELVYIPY